MTNDDRDQFEETRQQAVLANPEGCSVEQLKIALDTLDDDERIAWLEDNPEAYEEFEGPWSGVLDAFVKAPDKGIEGNR